MKVWKKKKKRRYRCTPWVADRQMNTAQYKTFFFNFSKNVQWNEGLHFEYIYELLKLWNLTYSLYHLSYWYLV
jgi:hypothetical protein